jgi:hypothetical protein
MKSKQSDQVIFIRFLLRETIMKGRQDRGFVLQFWSAFIVQRASDEWKCVLVACLKIRYAMCTEAAWRQSCETATSRCFHKVFASRPPCEGYFVIPMIPWRSTSRIAGYTVCYIAKCKARQRAPRMKSMHTLLFGFAKCVEQPVFLRFDGWKLQCIIHI